MNRQPSEVISAKQFGAIGISWTPLMAFRSFQEESPKAGNTRGASGRRALTTSAQPAGRLHVIAHRATLDVSRVLVHYTAGLLRAERRVRGTPTGSRALTLNRPDFDGDLSG
ncbi:hypothetical protein ABZU32_21260 [Sphaerisporangium sp. NPDC005288]|uniref:hypothetical protein n=1 Tax=Sphaerisporangium sp. NPDC005288 TaxID=3155114 RepID=UPI0033B0E933